MTKVRTPAGMSPGEIEILARLDAGSHAARERSGRRDGRMYWIVQGLGLAALAIAALYLLARKIT